MLAAGYPCNFVFNSGQQCRLSHDLIRTIKNKVIDFVVVEKHDRLHSDLPPSFRTWEIQVYCHGRKSRCSLDIPPRCFIFHTDEGFGLHEGFLPAGVPCIIAAPGGCGKTFLLIQAAVAAACGTTWLHAKALKPMHVLYLAGEEDKSELARRLQSVLKSMGIYENKKLLELVNQNLRLFPRVGNNERLIDDDDSATETFKKLKFFLEKHPEIKLVILDPASKYMGCETEKDAAKAQNWVDLLWQISLTEGKPSVLVAHHTRKDSNKNTILKANDKDKAPDMDLDLIRGSGGLVNGFRWAMLLARREYDDNIERVFLRVVKANYTKRSGVLQFDPDKNHGGILQFKGAAVESQEPIQSSVISYAKEKLAYQSEDDLPADSGGPLNSLL
jgi:hypothetical protein